VLPQKRIRLTHRDAADIGTKNYLPAINSTLESGVPASDWAGINGAGVLTGSARATDGTKSLFIDWPTAAAGALPWAQCNITGLTIGRTYTAAADVWTSASPNLTIGIYALVNGQTTSTKSAWVRISVTFTATSTSHLLLVFTGSATTSGTGAYVDSIQVDEGDALSAFSTSSPEITPKFDGHVDEWPVEWPGGSETYSHSTITAADLLSRIGARQKLRSVVSETILAQGPHAYFPLSESEGSLTAGDISGNKQGWLKVETLGSAGTLTFAEGTGPPTDGASAPVFAPSAGSGQYLLGQLATRVGYGDVTLAVTFNAPSGSGRRFIAGAFDDFGNGFDIALNTSGNVVLTWYSGYLGPAALITVTSGSTYHNAQTHHAMAVMSQSAGLVTGRLYLNGSSVGSATYGPPAGVGLYGNVYVGGTGAGDLFTGTISHLAIFNWNALTGTEALEQRTSQTTGFAGESSDERIARVAGWAGVPASRLALDAGVSTSIGHVECTGMAPLDYMRKVEDTEAGLLFADRDGQLTFYNRARAYTPGDPDLTVPSRMLEPSARMVKNLALVKNRVTGTRKDGGTAVLFDQDSIDTYGDLDKSLELVTTSDEEAMGAVGWRLNTNKDPRTRFTNMDLEGLTDATYSPSIRDGVAIGARVQVTGMPSQAPASVLDQAIEGYTETITADSWAFSVNASPYTDRLGLVLDDATYGTTDSTNLIAY
jgi:hypothetical protein